MPRRPRAAPASLPADPVLAALHPSLAAWFRGRFGVLSPAQHATLPAVLAGHTTLLCSPTGSGKTLAAFLGVFDWLVRAHTAGTLPDRIVAVYVSPLRALAYDLQKNLHQPLAELGWDWLRLGSRTGDTTAAERAAQRRQPPHLLVTTPESLTLLLGQPGWVPHLRDVRFLIIDELHALAENKRGALLMVAAERLEEIRTTGVRATERQPEETSPGIATSASAPPPSDGPASVALSSVAPSLCSPPLLRIGLSATVAPLEEAAAFLAGPGRPCHRVELADPRPAELSVFSPLRRQPYPPAGYTAHRVLAELARELAHYRTTLIFTNTRSGAESIGHRLKQLLPALAPQIEVHHASLDREVRLTVEDRLKRGELRAVVCSTSLELGIDIGSIDLVVMVSAPKGVARALQRLGRSGHSLGETSRGLLVATNINDLAECAVTARMMAQRTLDPLRFPHDPLDVLAQHLVGLAIFGDSTLDAAFALVRRSHPFRALARHDFDRVVRYLEGGGTSLEHAYRHVFGKLVVQADGTFTVPSPRVARDFWQNVGTIHTEAMIQVRLGARNLGQVEESFLKGLRPGDVFVLQGRTVRLVETTLLTAKVTAAESALPTVPRWNANKMPLQSGLATAVARLRTDAARILTPAPPSLPGAPASPASGDAVSPAAPFHAPSATFNSSAVAALEGALARDYALSASNAAALARHFALQAAMSEIPTAETLLIEAYADREQVHVFFHTLIGRSANDALSRIVAQRVQQTVGGNALVTIDDYGFLLTLRPFQAAALPDAAAWRPLFARAGAEDDLRAALAGSELVKWQFRGVAQTGLMVPRRVQGAERGARSLQWSSEILFDVLRRHEPDHPLLAEAYVEATQRFLDLPRALTFLDAAGALAWRHRVVPRVSPFAFGLFVSKIKETMMLEDPDTTIERLYHEMYGALAATDDRPDAAATD